MLTQCFSYIIVWTMKGIRMYHSKIWCLRKINILSWRNVRNSRCRKDSLNSSSPLKQVIRFSYEKCPPCTWEKGASKDGGMLRWEQAYVFPSNTLNSWPFVLLCFSKTFLLYNIPNIKTLRFNHFTGSSFPFLCHIEIILKLSAFSLVNLSFVISIYRA